MATLAPSTARTMYPCPCGCMSRPFNRSRKPLQGGTVVVTITDLKAAQFCRKTGITAEIAGGAAEKMPALAPLAAAMQELAS